MHILRAIRASLCFQIVYEVAIKSTVAVPGNLRVITVAVYSDAYGDGRVSIYFTAIYEFLRDRRAVIPPSHIP